jgi:5-formyltetrahydrofolate cyclo-ligase
MGAGFYDRRFAFRRRFGRWRHPLLLGVAWPFQEVVELAPREHDVALDGVLTPDGLIWFKKRNG